MGVHRPTGRPLMRLEVEHPDLAAAHLVRSLAAAVHGYVQLTERAVHSADLYAPRPPLPFVLRAYEPPRRAHDGLWLCQVDLVHLPEEGHVSVSVRQGYSLGEHWILVGIEERIRGCAR